MIVIDDNLKMLNWLNQLDLTIGYAKVNLDTFEIANGFDTELIMIHEETLNLLSENLKEKLNSCAGVIVYKEKTGGLNFYFEKIIAVVSPESDQNLICNQIHFFESQFKFNNILKSQLMTINKELIEIGGGVESQIIRVKKAYEQSSPKRLEKFKGISLFSKYAAGDNMGGEYFDIFTVDNKVFMLVSSTTSYLASSSILQLFADAKKEKEINDEMAKNLMVQIQEEISNLNNGRKNKVELQIASIIFDVQALEFSGYILGTFQMISSNSERSKSISNLRYESIEELKFSQKISRGERIMINSPGFIYNWNKKESNFMIEELLMDNKIKSIDVLDEAFFNLKKDLEEGFLPSDASSILLEVKENVMVQI